MHQISYYPEPPGEIDIVSVQWLAIRPYLVRAQLDRPVLEISGDVTIGNTRNFCRQARMNHALRVAVEERGKNGLIDQDCKRFRNAVGNKRMRLLIQVVNPGASLHWRTSRGVVDVVGVPVAPQALRISINTATMEKANIRDRDWGLLSIMSSS